MRTSAELRAGYRAFFESKGHVFRPSAPLVPRADDRSTLLTTAGMQPLMPYFLVGERVRRRSGTLTRRGQGRVRPLGEDRAADRAHRLPAGHGELLVRRRSGP